jgi:hypothetical protein
MLRDYVFPVEPAHLVTRHGFSDILYQGLGAVPNDLGIIYSDSVSREAAERIDPKVQYCSADFFKIMRTLYLEVLMQNPVEVARIYLEKARLILQDEILPWAPPLWVVLTAGLAHLFVSTRARLWQRINFSQGILIEAAACTVCFADNSRDSGSYLRHARGGSDSTSARPDR